MTRMLIILAFAFVAAGCEPKPRAAKKNPEPKATADVAAAEPVVKVAAAPNASAVIRITGIRNENPERSAEKALQSAIQKAQWELMGALRTLEPPVMAEPSRSKIRAEYLKQDSIREIEPTAVQKEKLKQGEVDPNRYWVEIDVEMTAVQVQRLRARDRVDDAMRGGGMILALALAVFGFLRIDAWSKGYLTTWLALAAVALAAGGVLMILRGALSR